MPGNVDDFIKRFGSQQTMDDREASQYLDRFASADPKDQDFDQDTMSQGATEFLGKLPDNDFEQAARSAYASASPDQQQGLMGSLMRALQGHGGGAAALSGLFGGNVPSRLSPDQYAHAANLVRQRHPEAMRQVVHEQPWFVKAMGNPVLMGALGVVASRMLKQRAAPPQANRRRGLFGI